MSVSAKLEFSSDPLSGAATNWTDISGKLMSASGGDGKRGELDQPAAGTATFVLKDPERDLEPGYSGGLLPEPLHRFRFSLNDGSGWTPWGLWYATRYVLAQPGGTTRYQEVEVDCVDGFGLLSLSHLGLLSPPDATAYADVVTHDNPWGYWRLGDLFGTKLTAAVGPEGTIHGLPALGVPGLLIGDPDTAARFQLSLAQHARAPVEQANQFSEPNTLTVEAWVRLEDDSVDTAFVTGPNNAVNGPIFALYFNQLSARPATFEIIQSNGATTAVEAEMVEGQTYHLVGTWENQRLRLYVNGVLATPNGENGTASLPLLSAPASEAVRIGRWGTTGLYANATIDDVAVYEHALSPEQVLAHYQAGAQRGYPLQTAGARVLALCTSPLWAETEIDTGGPLVAPAMEHGQPVLEEVLAAVKAELPAGLFFFDGDGNPVHLSRDFQSDPAYSTVQVILGGPAGIGEVGYRDVTWVYEHDVFTEVTTSNGDGLEATYSEAGPFPLPHEETGLTLESLVDLETAAAAVLELYREGRLRIDSVALGPRQNQVAQLLARRIGEMVRIKHRGPGGAAIDQISHILGRSWSYDGVDELLTGSWNLSRGFDAAETTWRLGITGYSELSETTILG